MRIEIASCSYRGGRDYNEDSIRYKARDSVCAVVVADGLGGHGGGHSASSITAESITEMFMQNPDMDADSIRNIFERTNTAVVHAQTLSQKMKSTGVALFIVDSAAVWGHVGDSRLYRFKDGLLVNQTIDHSVSQMAVFSGEITSEQIRHHADRNKLLKAFGLEERFKAEIAPVSDIEPGIDSFLLCTDGFWEYVWELEMEIELAKAETPQDWIKAMTQRLARRAPQDQDNFSAAAVFICR